MNIKSIIISALGVMNTPMCKHFLNTLVDLNLRKFYVVHQISVKLGGYFVWGKSWLRKVGKGCY